MQLPANIDLENNPTQSKLSDYPIIDTHLSRVKELITSLLISNSDFAHLRGLADFFNRRTGKMFRPALVLLAGQCCGQITDQHIHIAAIVEMIHNATLLHDDVLDHARKRRGGPTINSLEGNEAAILLGDFLISRALKICADIPSQIINIISDTTAHTCEGELTQTLMKNNFRLTESQYIDIITKKTAALLSSCCRLGALSANANQKQIQSLADFGHYIGITFQLTDDLLDIIGTETKMGKTLGTDADKNKPTLPIIHLLTKLNKKEKNSLLAKLNTIPRTEITDLLNSHDSLTYVRQQAKEFAQKAIQSLTHLDNSPAKNALIQIADSITTRAN